MDAVKRMHTQLQQRLPMQEYTLNFGTFQFFSDYVTSAIFEGVNLDTEKLLQFYSLCHDVFEDQAFSVIELRDFSFSIDPLFYLQCGDLLKNVKSHSMVIDPLSRSILNTYEANFIKHCPFKTFYKLSDAIDWTRSQTVAS